MSERGIHSRASGRLVLVDLLALVVVLGMELTIGAGDELGGLVRLEALVESLLGGGWKGFDFQAAFGRPTKVVNDAVMQAIGSYEGGRMLYLGLGTGLGSTMIVDDTIVPMELAHLPFRRATFEDYVGRAARARLGPKRWREAVLKTIEHLSRALLPDYVVLGGGLADELVGLPANVRVGGNELAFLGGFRLWD